MVLRFLFGLTISLASGSAVAIVLTAAVGQLFPDPTAYQQKPSLAEPYHDARWVNGKPSVVGPPVQENRTISRATGVPETAPEWTPVASAPPDPEAAVRQLPQMVLTQDPSPDREQVLATATAVELPAEGDQEPGSSKAAALPANPDAAADRPQSGGQVSVQERRPEPGQTSKQNAHTGDSAAVQPAKAEGAHTVKGRSTRTRHVLHVRHAHQGRLQEATAAPQHQAQK
jgi:hypothetical protein